MAQKRPAGWGGLVGWGVICCAFSFSGGCFLSPHATTCSYPNPLERRPPSLVGGPPAQRTRRAIFFCFPPLLLFCFSLFLSASEFFRKTPEGVIDYGAEPEPKKGVLFLIPQLINAALDNVLSFAGGQVNGRISELLDFCTGFFHVFFYSVTKPPLPPRARVNS